MNNSLVQFTRAWLLALRRHLAPGAPDGMDAAQKLGHRAVALGLETLELARIHDDALHALLTTGTAEHSTQVDSRRAAAFFTEALTPIEETHRGAREANVQLQQMIATNTRRTEELATANAELRLLSHRLLTVQEEERKRISRELHDVIGQALAGINLRLATLNSQTTANSRDLHQKIAITQRIVEKSVAIVHRFARDLRPAVLDDLGLIPALSSYIKTFTAGTGLRVDFRACAGVERQDASVRTVLYRVVQEALSNVARHARASRATVRIMNRKGSLHMRISDNGAGFKESGNRRAKTSHRLGLLGMRERVEMVGGTFQVETSPGAGTTISVDLPPRSSSSVKKPLKIR